MEGTAGFVTALHGVAGCTSMSAVDPSVRGSTIAGLTVRHALERLDLAIVDNGELLGASDGLEIGTSTARLEVKGFPYAVSTLLTQPLEPRNPPTLELRFLIPDPDRAAFQRRNSPDVTQTVLNLRGHLTRGHSGAPILNGDGKVVGVGSGGIADGAVEISWGIPLTTSIMTELAAAPVSPRVATLGHMESDGLYVYENALPQYAPVTCFGKSLTAQRMVGHESLIASVDDKALLTAYISSLGVDDIRRGYVIFQDDAASIALVVPDSWTLATGTDRTLCTATSPLGQTIEYLYEPIAGTTALPAAQRVEDVEYDRYCRLGDTIEPHWTSPTSRYSLLRGIATRRKAYLRSDHRCGPPGVLPAGMPGSSLGFGQLPLAWNSWSTPAPLAKGPLQCQVRVCPMGQMNYPDVWIALSGQFPYVAPVSIVHRWGFASYTISETGVLMGFANLDDEAAIQGSLSCERDGSFTPACRRLIERQREWSTGVVAVVSSTLTPR